MNLMDCKNWSIVIPAYNEEDTCEPVFRELTERYPEAEILVVNDGSTDRTAEIAAQYGARVIHHPRNRGNGAAIKTGARNASREVIIFMDSDGQHKPEDIPRLVEPLSWNPPYELSVGARTRASDTKAHRDLANWIYNRFSSALASYPIQDLTSGFRAIRRRVMRRFIPLLPNTFSYPTTLTIAIIRSGMNVAYVPIVSPQRKGKSKIRLFRDGSRFFIIMARVATLFAPMRVFLPVSLFLFVCGAVYMLAYVLKMSRTPNFSQTLIVASVMNFMMGLIAEQIAQLRVDLTERMDQPEDSGKSESNKPEA